MILVETSKASSGTIGEQSASAASAPLDSNSVINTANALLAISAALSAQSQANQSNQLPAILKLQNAIADNIKSVTTQLPDSQTSSESPAPSEVTSTSDNNHIEDLIYKNGPLRHYHNRYRSTLTNQINSTKQNGEQNTNSASASSCISQRYHSNNLI